MDPNYRRRSQNDDEHLFFVLPTLEEGSSSQPSKKKPIHNSIRNGATYIHETLTGHEALCKRRFHMEREIFEALVRRLHENNLLADSRYLSVEEQLGIFLYAVSKNASSRTLQYIFQHTGETITRHFRAVLKALTQLMCNYIQLPSLHPHRILRHPKFAPYFQNCIGAIDGTHLPMAIPPGQQEPHRNRKQGLSQNMMVACDFDLKFVHVHAGWEGSASDARVLQDALNHGFSVPPGKFYLVDAGYANTPEFIAPYVQNIFK